LARWPPNAVSGEGTERLAIEAPLALLFAMRLWTTGRESSRLDTALLVHARATAFQNMAIKIEFLPKIFRNPGISHILVGQYFWLFLVRVLLAMMSGSTYRLDIIGDNYHA
jgi:hypothetical protein